MDHLEQKQMRAEEADRIVNSALFNEAFDAVRRAYLETWAALPDGDDKHGERAHDLHRMVKCADRFKKCLTDTITTGKLATKELEGRKNMFGRRR